MIEACRLCKHYKDGNGCELEIELVGNPGNYHYEHVCIHAKGLEDLFEPIEMIRHEITSEDWDDGSNIWHSFEDELLKLILLTEQAKENKFEFDYDYLLEKLYRAYNKCPIVLHPGLNSKYLELRRKEEEKQT